MNGDKIMEAIGMIDDEIIAEAKKPVKKRFGAKKVLALVAALIIIFAFAVTSNAVKPFIRNLFKDTKQFVEMLKPVNVSCISEGIEMKVISANVAGSETYIYISMQDLEGNRIDDSFDLYDSYSISRSFDGYGTCEKVDFDKETGEILTASSELDINEELIREEELLDGYYVLVTSEMDEPDDKIIDMYRGLWKIEESFKLTKSELEARPVYVWTQDHIEAHFLTCFVALTLTRILEMKLENKYSSGRIIESLTKSECSLLQQNYYHFDYYDEILKDIGKVTGIDFSKRIRTLGDIKQELADTKRNK